MGSRTWRGFTAAVACLLASTSLQAQVAVPTYHNDNSRTGQNTAESILTPSNVNSTTFGKLFTVSVDGSVYAQPLYIPNVSLNSGTHNVLFVATQHDSVYAIDADTGTIYWQVSLIPTGGSTVNSSTDLSCGDIPTEVGITGTPVIDPTTNTLYVVAKSKVSGTIYQYLHALDLGSGAEKFGGPANIAATSAGTATDGTGSTLTFNPRQENQRAALLLENGHVVIAWASHCDKSPWHGWVISYGAATLAEEAVYNSSPSGYANGIWMSGSGLAADTSGNIYGSTGNGSWNTKDRGDTILKLGPPADSTFAVEDYFTPYNQAVLTSDDTDLSAGGIILLPTLPSGQQLLTTIGKSGTMYLVDRNNMGKYCTNLSPACNNADTNVVQEVNGAFSGYWGVPAYWNGSVYFGGGNDNTGEAEPIRTFSFNAKNSGLLSTTPTSSSAKSFNFPGPIPSVSSNGTSNGILWGLDNSRWRNTCASGANCQVLYAYDATNLANLLYTSNDAANFRDVPGSAVKFTTPTVANGKVYVGGVQSVSAFGLLAASTPTAAAPTLSSPGGTYTSAGLSLTLSDTTSNATIYYTTDGSTPNSTSTRYNGAISITTTTTVKAIAAASGFVSSTVTSATYTIQSASTTTSTAVSLAASYNVTGITNNGSAVASGGLDGGGNSYSEALLGAAVVWNGITFNMGSVGVADAVSNATVALTSGSYTTLNLLATAVDGNHAGQAFVITYTDGTTTTVTQSLSDWHTPQSYPGESIAVTMPYRLLAAGTEDARPFYLYGYSFTLNGAKTVKTITLPPTRDVIVLAMSLTGAVTTPTGTATTSVSLASTANVYGTFTDGTAVTNGGLDAHSDAYSATLLGSSVTWSNLTFTLGAAATANTATRATIPLPAGQYTTLNLLATGVEGAQTGQTFLVTYTDGTSTTITQSLSDWFTPQSYTGESKAVTMAYRLLPTGAKDARTFNLYGYSFAINSAKTVASLTLPNNRHVVVLAATLSGGTTSGGTGSKVTQVSLSSAANVNAIFTDGTAISNGGIDAHSDAYSETLVGSTLNFGGVSYTFLGANALDAISSTTLTLPSGQFSTLNLLGTGVEGNKPNQTFVVTYTDGTATTITQSMSDWFAPQSYTGESKALTTSYRLISTGAQDARTFYLYAYSLAINNAKTVASVTLPNNH
jgi:hypothetical protein